MFFGPSPDRQTALNWAKQGHIKPDNLDAALTLVQATPSNQQWLSFILKLLLWFSAAAIAAAVIFFFAFNWQSISNLVKFASLQSLILLTAVVYTRLDHRKVSGLSTITLITFLTGALLALVGQIYQTGADPWQLFAIWALFTAPWALLHRASTLWVTFILLINLACYLYAETFRGLLGFLFKSEELLAFFLALNTVFIILLETGFSSQLRLLNNRIAAQLTLFSTGTIATWLALWAIFDDTFFQWAGAAYVIWILIALWYYRCRQLDLFALSGIATSLIITSNALFFSDLDHNFNEEVFLLISISIIGMSTAAGIWLKRLHQEQHKSEEQPHE